MFNMRDFYLQALIARTGLPPHPLGRMRMTGRINARITVYF